MISAELARLQAKMFELQETRKEMALNLAISLGVEDPTKGVNLDELSMWARQVRKINTQISSLAEETRALRTSN